MTDIAEPDWAEIKRLYDAVAELPPAARNTAIAAAAVSESVRNEVRSLLAHDPDGTAFGVGGFLNQPAASQFTAAGDSSTDDTKSATPQRTGDRLGERFGERFGAWQIVAPLGTGGMGDVFEAERADGSYRGRARSTMCWQPRSIGSATMPRRCRRRARRLILLRVF